MQPCILGCVIWLLFHGYIQLNLIIFLFVFSVKFKELFCLKGWCLFLNNIPYENKVSSNPYHLFPKGENDLDRIGQKHCSAVKYYP